MKEAEHRKRNKRQDKPEESKRRREITSGSRKTGWRNISNRERERESKKEVDSSTNADKGEKETEEEIERIDKWKGE